MRETVLTMLSGEKIYVYDDVFQKNETFYWLEFAQNSLFNMQSYSSPSINHNSDTFFQSNFSQHELEQFDMQGTEGWKNIKHHFATRYVERAWILAASHNTHFYFHPDAHRKLDGKTLLYYMNIDWNDDWGGETLFCDANGFLERAVSFKPNRVVIFDSHLMHRNTQISVKTNQIRLTFVAQFKWPKATVAQEH